MGRLPASGPGFRPVDVLRRASGRLNAGILAILVFACAGFAIQSWALSAPAAGKTFEVNSRLDRADDGPGDGVCRARVGTDFACTLRAAIMESNALPGADTI